ncbi:MAG: hypothetical protein J6U17_02190 [Kiritimatiellae bacterium]|nr:hypothetical protein [Kiritimatiellia bacterium]
MRLGWFRSMLAAVVAVAALMAADGMWTALDRLRRRLSFGTAVEYRYAALDVLAAHTVLMERPDSRSALVVGPGSAPVAESLSIVGLSCSTNGVVDARYGLVIACGRRRPDWRTLVDRALPDGAVAWFFNVRDMSARELRDGMKAFPGEEARLWMVGEDDWLLTGRLEPCLLKLDKMLEMFLSDGAIEELVKSGCDSLPELFASYAGARSDITPAFESGDLSAKVRPEFFLSKEIPAITWIDKGAAEDDIYKDVMQEIRSMQVVRRVVVEGNMLSRAGKVEESIDKWASAMLRNPHDSMLLDRLYRLAVNASAFEKIGNIPGAAKCYETMVAVRPKDIAALEHYAECLRRLGNKEIAEAIDRRAMELRR